MLNKIKEGGVILENTKKSKGSLIKDIARNKICYFFMAPYGIIFLIFTITPVIAAIALSFSAYNGFQNPVFVGWKNYNNLFVNDSLFLTAIKNTMVFAIITGPIGYLLSLIFAWLINDLSPNKRAFMTLLFYAPSLSNIFIIWKLIFSGDSYGILNAYLMKLNIIQSPILWLQNADYMVGAIVIVILWASMGTSFLSFIAGFQSIDGALFEAGAVDGIKNRFQELWFITLPSIKPQLMFGAIMSITASFGIGGMITALVGFPSPNYAAHTMVHHLEDYGNIRFDVGYACAIAVTLFVIMIFANNMVQKMLRKVGE